MKISSIKFFPYRKQPDSALKATATVVLNHSIIIQSLRIVADPDDPQKFRVSYPTRRLESGAHRPCCIFRTEESKQYFREEVLKAYEQFLANPEQAIIVLEEEPETPEPFSVTDVSVYLLSDEQNRLRARVNIELDGELTLCGMILRTRQDGSLILQMPQRLIGDAQRMALYHPLSTPVRNVLTQAVMPYYDEAVRAAAKASATSAVV